MKNNTSKAIAVIAIMLLLIALGWGIIESGGKKAKVRTIKGLNNKMELLVDQKDSLETTVDSLQKAYDRVSESYVVLEGTVDDAKREISRKESIIRNLRKTASAEVDSLTQKVTGLLNDQKELLASVQLVEEEKLDLLAKLKDAKGKMDSLNVTINREMNKLALARFKGTSFRADVEKRSDKVTAKARKARAITISFDLNGVPERFQGAQPLYLVIADQKGTPLNANEATKVIVEENNRKVELLAQQVKELDIKKDQQVSFSYELDDKLEPGVYTAIVYSKIGPLGSVSFQLR